jgi:hypothetical protein
MKLLGPAVAKEHCGPSQKGAAVTANPVFNDKWWTISSFGAAHSDASIGMFVQRFPINGGPDDLVDNDSRTLWNKDSFGGTESHSDYFLSRQTRAQFLVDTRHWYIVWLFCRGKARGAGWGFLGSAAGSYLSVAVSSMTWKLYVFG